MRKELLKGLTEEQIKKVESCKDSSEILAFAKAEGIELTDEQLEAVSGGGGCFGGTTKCPECGSNDVKTDVKETKDVYYNSSTTVYKYKCKKCGYKWEEKTHR